jgi:basic amino acid/polyamine antiporter, APA family
MARTLYPPIAGRTLARWLAERIPREAALRRVHGTGALFSAAYGNVGSSIYYALGLVALYALGLTPVTFLIAGLIFAFTAATYVEATVLYPEAGGSSSFARHAFNEAASFFAAWAQMLTYIVTVAISAFFVPHYLAVFWEPLGHGPGDVIFGICLVAALAALNIKGTEESARLNLVLAIADLLTQVVLVIIGLAIVFDPDLLVSQIDLGTVPTWGDFALGIAVGMVAYTGIETISNMAEEARSAHRTIPQGTGLTVLAVVGLYALLPAIALSAMPVTQDASGQFTTELGTTYADDPVLGIVENLGLGAGLTDALEVYVGILAAVILLIATNAALIGLSRLTFSMGQYRQLPEALRQIHPRFKTPYVAIMVFSGVAALVMAPGQTTFLGTIYAFGATLSFTVAHVSVIRLRRLKPVSERAKAKDGSRLWTPPGNVKIRGVDVPPTAILGGIGTFGAFVVAMALDPVVLATGGGWMLAGLLLYVIYRRHQGLPLTRTVKVQSLEPLGVEEVEYQSILVAFEQGTFSEEVVATAKALGARKRRAIHVVSMIEVPTNMPLDAPLDAEEGAAQSVIERAKLICGQRVTGSILRVRPGQAGGAIVAAARELGATAIVVPLRYRAGVPLYGKTLQTVLSKRPCRVIVAASPEEARAGIVAPSPA